MLQAQEWTLMFHFFSGSAPFRLLRSRRAAKLWMRGFTFLLFTAGVMQNEHCPKYEILVPGCMTWAFLKPRRPAEQRFCTLSRIFYSFCGTNKYTIKGIKCKTGIFSFSYARRLVPCVGRHQSAVCLIDCIRRLIGHSARGWISSQAASPPAASSIELHSPGDAPLPCSGFHRPASAPPRLQVPFSIQRLFFHKRLMDKKHVRKQLLYSAVRRARPLFITCVYIFSIKEEKQCYVADECSVWLPSEWNKKYPPPARRLSACVFSRSPLGMSGRIWGGVAVG